MSAVRRPATPRDGERPMVRRPTKVADVAALVALGRARPRAALPAIRALARCDDWKAREVAATALVEISQRQPGAVVAACVLWARDASPNVRRTASEGLRHVARTAPEQTLPVLEQLRRDDDRYVQKSVGNILRNASGRHGAFVLGVCRRWAAEGDDRTRWIVRDGLRKLVAMRDAEATRLSAHVAPTPR